MLNILLAIINLLMVLETPAGDFFYDIFFAIGEALGEIIVILVELVENLFF